MKKEKINNTVVKNLNKKFGSEIVFKGRRKEKIEGMPTGLLEFDSITGVNGFPKGRVCEISGQPSVGKTSIALSIIGNLQKQGVSCAFIDAEHSLDTSRAEELGVDVESLFIAQPEYGEQGFEIIEELVSEELAEFIVVDSVSALVPKSIIEGEVGKPQMGSQARLMANGLSRLVAPISKKGTVLLFINQLRMNIMGGTWDPFITPGGLSLKFYSSLRIRAKRKQGIGQAGDLVGYELELSLLKNKVGKPGEKCTIQFMFEGGIAKNSNVLAIALRKEIVERKGNTYYYGEIKLGVGRNAAETFISDDQQLSDSLLDAVKSQLS